MTRHILIGLLVGSALGVLAGSAALTFAAPSPLTVQANKSAPVVEIPEGRTWDI